MRTYYLFNIDDNFAYIYYKTPEMIFGILKQINNLNHSYFPLAYRSYKELVVSFHEKELSLFLKNYHQKEMAYQKKQILPYNR